MELTLTDILRSERDVYLQFNNEDGCVLLSLDTNRVNPEMIAKLKKGNKILIEGKVREAIVVFLDGNHLSWWKNVYNIDELTAMYVQVQTQKNLFQPFYRKFIPCNSPDQIKLRLPQPKYSY